MNAILEAAASLQRFCSDRAWRFCFIGGIAVQRWGEPRHTQDADLTLITGFGGEEPYVDSLLTQFTGRIPEARTFALENRVLLAKTAMGIPLDIALGAMPFEERTVERATFFAYSPECSLFTCSAEDLIVHKAFAGRDRDWLDIDGKVRSYGRRRFFSNFCRCWS